MMSNSSRHWSRVVGRANHSFRHPIAIQMLPKGAHHRAVTKRRNIGLASSSIANGRLRPPKSLLTEINAADIRRSSF
jgi:hypothetical protein